MSCVVSYSEGAYASSGTRAISRVRPCLGFLYILFVSVLPGVVTSGDGACSTRMSGAINCNQTNGLMTPRMLTTTVNTQVV